MYSELTAIRKRKKYSLADMGNVIGKSPANYYKKEQGDVSFTIEEAKKIASFLKVNINKIFFTENVSESERKEG